MIFKIGSCRCKQIVRIMRLNFKKFGKGKPLVVLHGLFGMSDNWLTISKKIARKHTVYLPDLRNHGDSPHTDEFNYDILSNDLEEFLEQHGIDNIRLIGHSMGGKAAMCFALKFPDRIEKLVLVDIAPRKYEHPFFRNLLDFMLKIDLKSYGSRSEIENAFKEVIKNKNVRLFILKNINRTEDDRYEWKINVSSLSRNLDNIFAEIKSDKQYEGSVLVVRGGLSDYVEDKDIPQIKELFPNAKIVTIDNAGHWLHVEAEKAFCDQLKSFFDEGV
jgi:esterase